MNSCVIRELLNAVHFHGLLNALSDQVALNFNYFLIFLQ